MLKYVPFAPYADREIGHVAMAADAALRHLSQKEDGAVANPTALAEGKEIIWWRYNPSPRKRLVPRTVATSSCALPSAVTIIPLADARTPQVMRCRRRHLDERSIAADQSVRSQDRSTSTGCSTAGPSRRHHVGECRPVAALMRRNGGPMALTSGGTSTTARLSWRTPPTRFEFTR